MSTEQSEREPLWQDGGGRIACLKDSGGYLRAAVSARPKAMSHITPIGRFHRITQVDVDQWDEDVVRYNFGDLGPLCCEDCHVLPLIEEG